MIEFIKIKVVRTVVKTQSEHSRFHISYAAWLQLRMLQSIALLSTASHSVLYRGLDKLHMKQAERHLCDVTPGEIKALLSHLDAEFNQWTPLPSGAQLAAI